MAISKAVAKKLMKRYRRRPGTTPVDSTKISQMLKKGASVPMYKVKNGGYIAKKGKKVVKKRKK